MDKPKAHKQYESRSFWVRSACLLADTIGRILFLPFRANPPAYKPQEVKRIAIFRLDGLGDVILSTAALREIRHGFPQARITLIVSPWAADIIKHSPFFDELVVYDSFLFHVFRGNWKFNPLKEFQVIASLRKQNFDLGLDLRGDILSIIPMFLSKCRHRFATASRGGSFLLTSIIPYDHVTTPSQQQKNLLVVKALGIPIRNKKLELTIDPASEAKIDEFLAENQLVGKRLVSMAPCALYKWRSWPPAKFAQLAREILPQWEVSIILIGSQEQYSILEDINQMADNRLINAAGKFSLAEVAALLKRSALCISNESGIMHLVAAFEIPLIQLFGPGPPAPFAHYYPQSRLIQKADHCPYYPCTQRNCKNKPNWCMDKITVSDVLNVVKTLLPEI